MKLKINYRNYKMFGEIDLEHRKFQNITNTLRISNADAERGFSQMNLIINLNGFFLNLKYILVIRIDIS